VFVVYPHGLESIDMSNRYKRQPCAYCGKVTDQNEGDHVLPKSFYPTRVDPKLQWAKVSCCPNCNDEFQKDEAHFKTILTAAGDILTPVRLDHWQDVRRGFSNPISGHGDRQAAANGLVPVMHQGRLRFKVYPGKDERVTKIVRKIVRGLSVYKKLLPPPVRDEQVWVDVWTYPIIPEMEERLIDAYEVPGVARCRYSADRILEHPNCHSGWLIQLLDVPFIGLLADPETPASPSMK
jgi:hypothetical protein